MASPWTVELVAELRQLHAEGLSTTEIAQRLSEKMPDGQVFTKNQVIGKLDREGLTKAREAESMNSTYVASNQLDLFPPLGTCVFAKGDGGPAGWQFCGAPLAFGSASYCREHRKVCGDRTASRSPLAYVLRKGMRGLLNNRFDDEW